MKKDIHPKYYPNAVIKCSCGNKITAGSTKESMDIEICSACHPFFTGKEKIIDTAGRVEKFKTRMAKKEEVLKKKETTKKTVKKAPKKEPAKKTVKKVVTKKPVKKTIAKKSK